MISTDYNGMLDSTIPDSSVHLNSALNATLCIRVKDSSLRADCHFVLLCILNPLDIVLYLYLNVISSYSHLILKDIMSNFISNF